ncbi:BT_3987 domain-containing protein [Reichenbachiella ulvae]|uniref:DUF1735 domain-containing protein n=1 Tax=Reichenbachiella ulvae TaxID=2980104 RepID=A0ABT3D051_9BACT|nr:DUF1735 domain-containing protein [Reichenbachiella ulvae]MCV9389272.1 DUF1735 domain-containing protein [Reichenbachiella ulvae]
MKKNLIYIMLIGLFLSACSNQERVFDDYEEQNVYFPIQYPVRTLSLNEESRIDNSIDLEHAFSIGAAIGGLYSNDQERVVDIALAPELLNNVTVSGAAIELMPASYYTLSSADQIVIPKGQFSGTIRVELTDDFFNDPLAIGVNYVIPLVITGADDNIGILRGVASEIITDPDRRISSDWSIAPKDYTLFAVKYQNKFDGTYLHAGIDEALVGPGGAVDSVYSTFSEEFMEDNLLTDVETASLTDSYVNNVGRFSGQLMVSVDDAGDIVVSSAAGSEYTVNGTGKFLPSTDEGARAWGGIKRQTMVLDYEYEFVDPDDAAITHYHHVSDTLVYRNDNLVFEEFEIEVTP